MQNPSGNSPLIVTALIAAPSFTCLDALRRRHFPPALNKVPAHISLFHHLPGSEARIVLETVKERCRGRSAFELQPAGLVSLGRGVAIRYEAGALGPLHASLVQAFSTWLTPQDRQPFKPHVTIQNKASSAEARALQGTLELQPLPSCRIEGISIWWYRGGPWEPFADCPFEGAQYGETTA